MHVLGAHRLACDVVAATGLGGQIVEPDPRQVETVEGQDRSDPPNVLRAEPKSQFVRLSEQSLSRARCSICVVRGH